MQRTVAYNLKRIAQKGVDTGYRQEVAVVAVDYRSREIIVDGTPGRVKAAPHINLGTPTAPLVVPGNRGIVERVGDEYLFTLYLPLVGRNSLYATPIPQLSAPTWLSGYPRIAGTQLEGSWNGNAQAGQVYELWQNSSPTPIGATMHPISPLTNTSFSTNWNLGQSSELMPDGGFESGNATNWRYGNVSANPAFTIQTDVKHGGLYAAKLTCNHYPGEDFLWAEQSNPIGIVAGQTYTISLWHNITVLSGGSDFSLYLTWYRADGTYVSMSTLSSRNTPTSGWTQITAIVTAPALAGQALLDYELYIAPYAPDPVAYVDDFSFIGQPPTTPVTTFYALRLRDAATGYASPFSAWLQPTQTTAKVGSQSIEIDPATSTIRSENFAAATPTGFSLDPTNGVQGLIAIAPNVHAAASKTTPVDADETALVDSAASNVLKKLTWANLKATLKTYFDTLYVAIASSSEPPGVIKAYGGASAPSGYLLCDGSAVSRTTYAALFAAIGTAYGAGDGSTTFNLPDLQGRMPIGKGTHSDVNALNKNDGLAVASRTPNHTHTGPSHQHDGTDPISGGAVRTLAGTAAPFGTGSTATGQPVANPTFAGNVTGNWMLTGAAGTGATGASAEPFVTVNFIIKT